MRRLLLSGFFLCALVTMLVYFNSPTIFSSSDYPVVDISGNFSEIDVPPSMEPEVMDGPSFSPPPPPDPSCNDDMIQTTSIASSTGGGQSIYGYGPENANDGVMGYPTSCLMHWISTYGAYPSGHWYRLQWPADVDVCEIFCDTKDYPNVCGYNPNRTLGNATIQYWNGSAWAVDGTIAGYTDDWSYKFTSCRTTNSIRLYNVYCPPGFQDSNPVLFELLVRSCGGSAPPGSVNANAGGPYTVECEGATTSIQLDGTKSTGSGPSGPPPGSNTGFELGDTTNWTLSIPTYAWAQVYTSYFGFTAPEGSYFLVDKSGLVSTYSTVSRTFTLNAGQTINGWAGWYSYDYMPYNDDGYVRVYQGASYTTVWSYSVSIGTSSPWTPWSFTAPSSGTYNVQVGVRNMIDSGVDSYVMFDMPEDSGPPPTSNLEFLWSTDCPGASFDDPTSATPILTVDSVLPPCPMECNVFLTATEPATAPLLVNGGFELGDYSGWTFLGNGYMAVVTSFSYSVKSWSPQDGNYFARIQGDYYAVYAVLQQTATLSTGDTLNGWAALAGGDMGSSYYNDYGRIVVNGPMGSNTIWDRYASATSYPGSDWEAWSFTAPMDGSYTISLEVRNGGDNSVDPYLLVDMVEAPGGSGGSDDDEATITVEDTTPPSIIPAAAGDLYCLWPPNHWYVCFDKADFSPDMTDDCSGIAGYRFTGCTSDQPDNGSGDGNTINDCIVDPDGETFCVRSERSGTIKEGRRYAITVSAVDNCDNLSPQGLIGYIHVPHDHRDLKGLDCVDPHEFPIKAHEDPLLVK